MKKIPLSLFWQVFHRKKCYLQKILHLSPSSRTGFQKKLSYLSDFARKKSQNFPIVNKYIDHKNLVVRAQVAPMPTTYAAQPIPT